MEATENNGGLKLIHASLYRMGSMSIAEAYKTLGFNPHHVHMSRSVLHDNNWEAFDRAVDGKWPDVAGATKGRRKFTREDWEAVRGDWDFFTDFVSHFTPDLIRAYPEAKVVVVQRDFESWWPSYKETCLDAIESPIIKVTGWVLRQITGYSLVWAQRRQYYGFYGVESLQDIDEAKARAAYDAFFEEVRRLVPPERRLEYSIKDGWEPLCEFLDKPVPDKPFPNLNSRKVLNSKSNKTVRDIWATSSFVVFGIAAAGLAAWYYKA